MNVSPENITLIMEENSTFSQQTLAEATAQPKSNSSTYQRMSGGDSVFSWSSYIGSLFILLLMLGALYGVLWLVKRYGHGKFLPMASSFNRNDLKVEAQLPLAAKKNLYVVRYLNKRLLIGVADNHISLITEDFIINSADAQASFKETVEQTINYTKRPKENQNAYSESEEKHV